MPVITSSRKLKIPGNVSHMVTLKWDVFTLYSGILHICHDPLSRECQSCRAVANQNIEISRAPIELGHLSRLFQSHRCDHVRDLHVEQDVAGSGVIGP